MVIALRRESVEGRALADALEQIGGQQRAFGANGGENAGSCGHGRLSSPGAVKIVKYASNGSKLIVSRYK